MKKILNAFGALAIFAGSASAVSGYGLNLKSFHPSPAEKLVARIKHRDLGHLLIPAGTQIKNNGTRVLLLSTLKHFNPTVTEGALKCLTFAEGTVGAVDTETIAQGTATVAGTTKSFNLTFIAESKSDLLTKVHGAEISGFVTATKDYNGTPDLDPASQSNLEHLRTALRANSRKYLTKAEVDHLTLSGLLDLDHRADIKVSWPVAPSIVVPPLSATFHVTCEKRSAIVAKVAKQTDVVTAYVPYKNADVTQGQLQGAGAVQGALINKETGLTGQEAKTLAFTGKKLAVTGAKTVLKVSAYTPSLPGSATPINVKGKLSQDVKTDIGTENVTVGVTDLSTMHPDTKKAIATALALKRTKPVLEFMNLVGVPGGTLLDPGKEQGVPVTLTAHGIDQPQTPPLPATINVTAESAAIIAQKINHSNNKYRISFDTVDPVSGKFSTAIPAVQTAIKKAVLARHVLTHSEMDTVSFSDAVALIPGQVTVAPVTVTVGTIKKPAAFVVIYNLG